MSEGPTQEYRHLAENPDIISTWSGEKLLKHFLNTRLMIETDSGMETNALRMGFVFQVSGYERVELLRRLSLRDPGVDHSVLKERLAAIEHERWSDWMKYMFSVCSGIFAPDRGPGSFIPADFAKRWIRQMNTPYAELTEEEKQSDRDQVERYWYILFPEETK